MASPLYCPNCNSKILAKDINIQKMIAKCDNCHAVFDFDNEERKPVKRERPEIPLPNGFDVLRLLSEMVITIHWKKTRHKGFFVLFTVIWNVCVLPFIIMAIVTNSVTMALIISLHAIIGFSFLYYTIAIYINKTTIDVSPHGIAVVTKPLNIPFQPNRYIEAKDLKQLYVEQYVESTTNNRPNYAYAVRAVVEGNDNVPKIIKGLKNENQALFVEHEIEKFLNIEDEIMP